MLNPGDASTHEVIGARPQPTWACEGMAAGVCQWEELELELDKFGLTSQR